MKALLLICALFVSMHLFAQNYIPLRLDSTYRYSWNIGLHQEIVTGEFYSGYSYDANDSLIQLRYPEYRFNYVYSQDTTHHVTEKPLPGNQWLESNRSTRTYQNGNLITKVDELKNNGVWEKSARYHYTYTSSNQLLVTLLQHWKNGAWVDFYKKEHAYDDNGNLIEEAEYYAIESSEFKYNRGKQYSYDDSNNLIESISLSSAFNGPYISGKYTWFYQGNKLDSLIIYDYDNNQWQELSRFEYDYSNPEVESANHYHYTGGNWKFTGQNNTYTGPGIYSEKPDSIISYYYNEVENILIPAQRKYLTYEDLGNGKIYFKEVEYTFFNSLQEWKLSLLNEEWYTVKSTVSTEQNFSHESAVSFFPNPCMSGENINIKRAGTPQTDSEMLIFDMQGRLISRENLYNKSGISAPVSAGIYNILLRENGGISGVTRLVVVD